MVLSMAWNGGAGCGGAEYGIGGAEYGGAEEGGAGQIAERRAYSQKVLFPEKFKPKLQAVSKSKALDLTDELDEEERLRVEAAEWMPSTVVSKKPESPDALEDKLGSAFDRIKKTVQVRSPCLLRGP